MAAITVSRLISSKDTEWHNEQISDKRTIKPPASKRLSSIMIRRFCWKIDIGRNCQLNKKELVKEVFLWTSAINCDAAISIFEKINLVYWKLTNPLLLYITLAETKVGKILKEINSNVQNDRQHSASLNPKVDKTD